MNDIINWLLNLEHLAGEIYSRAARYFSEDEDLKNFLEKIAEDESWHFSIMGSAAENLIKIPLSISSISIDSETDKKIKGLFNELSEKIESKTLTKQELLISVITAEFSEWNDIFLYVVNTLKNNNNEFSNIAAEIQLHKKTIEHYFETCPESADAIISYKSLTPVWEDRILIVDDEEAISEFLEALLGREGKIDKAVNGAEALELVKTNYYKLIISDIDMPVMDGITFFKAASEIDSSINERIIFFTGSASDERQTFFEENKLDYMTKPAAINLIKEKVLPVLLKKNPIIAMK